MLQLTANEARTETEDRIRTPRKSTEYAGLHVYFRLKAKLNFGCQSVLEYKFKAQNCRCRDDETAKRFAKDNRGGQLTF